MSLFLMRNWQAVLGALAVAVLSILLYIRTDQRDDARHDLRDCRQKHQLFVERSDAEAARFRAEFERRARETEANQTRISQETSREYQARLAALRADYERRLHTRPGSPGQSRPGGVPSVPNASSGPDGPVSTAPIDEFACEANTLQLDFLQDWVRQQLEVAPVTAGNSQ